MLLQLREIRREQEQNKLLFYTPVGKQPLFHKADGVEVRTRLFYGGNRSGKTTAGTCEALAHVLGYRPWLPKDDPHYVVKMANGQPIPVPNVGWIVAPYERDIEQTIWPKLTEWAPKDMFSHIKRGQRGVPVRVTAFNGSIINLMYYSQDEKAGERSPFEGQNGHWFWGDEPMPRRVYNGLMRAMVDFEGHGWITMTPLNEPWITEHLLTMANDNDSDVRVFFQSIWENCDENGGYLSRAAILGLLDKLSPEERKAREAGEPLHLTGRVFPEWRPEAPFYVEPFELLDNWPRVVVIDPHPRKPIAVLWAAITPDNQWVVYRDMSDPELHTIHEVSNAIKEREGWYETLDATVDVGEVGDRTVYEKHAGVDPVVLRIIDTSSKESERTSGSTIMERFAVEGLPCIEANKRNKEAGLDAIRSSLRLRNEWSEPGLIVFNTCHHVKGNFLQYVWPRYDSSRAGEKREGVREPEKRHDDFIDCIRYLFQMRLHHDMLRQPLSRLRRDLDTPLRERLRGIGSRARVGVGAGSTPRHRGLSFGTIGGR